MLTHPQYRRHLLMPAGVAIVLLAAGCSDSATGPNDDGSDPQAQVQVVTVTLNAVENVEPCEEAFTDIDGGEFGWRITVTWPDGTNNVLNGTSGFPGSGGYRQIKKNASVTSSATVSKQLPRAGNAALTVQARASEFDFDLFGNNPAPDSRMNDRQVTAEVRNAGLGWPAGDRVIDVRPVAACHLRVRYTVSVT